MFTNLPLAAVLSVSWVSRGGKGSWYAEKPLKPVLDIYSLKVCWACTQGLGGCMWGQR